MPPLSSYAFNAPAVLNPWSMSMTCWISHFNVSGDNFCIRGYPLYNCLESSRVSSCFLSNCNTVHRCPWYRRNHAPLQDCCEGVSPNYWRSQMKNLKERFNKLRTSISVSGRAGTLNTPDDSSDIDLIHCSWGRVRPNVVPYKSGGFSAPFNIVWEEKAPITEVCIGKN